MTLQVSLTLKLILAFLFLAAISVAWAGVPLGGLALLFAFLIALGLIREFNRLAVALGEKETQLHEHTQKLEQRVQEQTHTLRESEARFRVIFDGAAIGIALTDLKGRVVLSNPAMQKMLGYTAEELQEMASVAGFTHPDDAEESIQRLYDLAAEKAPGYQLEKRYLHRDGREVWGRLTTSLVRNEQEQPLFVVGMIEDITEYKQAEQALRESEERYRSLFQNNHSVMLLIDPEAGDIINANPAACAFYGYSQEEITHLKIGDINQLTPEQLFEEMARAKREQKRHFFFRHRLASGEVREVEVYSGPIKFQGKTLLYSIVHDVSERKRAEDQLAQLNQELQRSNAELAQFAYIASHDLQEPLRTVSSFVQLLARRYEKQLDAEAKEFIAYAVEGASRMKTLINALLAYSRVSTKGKPLSPTQSELVLKRVLANLQLALEESEASVSFDPLPTVLADEIQLEQLFQNLIANALKFHGEAPPRIHISVQPLSNFERQNGSGNRNGASLSLEGWLFAIQDNGIGIDAQFAERIFVIFQRLHTETEYPGTGIGLAICKKVVERHGGSIWVKSEPGQGATFYFTLPQAT